ncbi:MAG: hypothetical protein CG443_719, partial [Methanosaeta sp. ASP1-1]
LQLLPAGGRIGIILFNIFHYPGQKLDSAQAIDLFTSLVASGGLIGVSEIKIRLYL